MGGLKWDQGNQNLL